MFTVGEFSRLARVSKRLLRYYDEIGLLKPSHTDRQTGYRYYSAAQMPRLNRILALKDLGLSLDQIQRMLSDQITTDEIQGMLLLKKAEIERQLLDELQRIRNIEARLQFIRTSETNQPFDVVLKSIPAQSALSVRAILPSMDDGLAIFAQMFPLLAAQNLDGQYFAIMHSDGIDDSEVDMEVGHTIHAKSHAPLTLPNKMQLHYRELPAISNAATYVVTGPAANLLVGYSVIGTWAEMNGYRFAGTPREVALQLPRSADWSDGVMEIQVPVERVA